VHSSHRSINDTPARHAHTHTASCVMTRDREIEAVVTAGRHLVNLAEIADLPKVAAFARRTLDEARYELRQVRPGEPWL
jgi:hypothetical protein